MAEGVKALPKVKCPGKHGYVTYVFPFTGYIGRSVDGGFLEWHEGSDRDLRTGAGIVYARNNRPSPAVLVRSGSDRD